MSDETPQAEFERGQRVAHGKRPIFNVPCVSATLLGVKIPEQSEDVRYLNSNIQMLSCVLCRVSFSSFNVTRRTRRTRCAVYLVDGQSLHLQGYPPSHRLFFRPQASQLLRIPAWDELAEAPLPLPFVISPRQSHATVCGLKRGLSFLDGFQKSNLRSLLLVLQLRKEDGRNPSEHLTTTKKI